MLERLVITVKLSWQRIIKQIVNRRVKEEEFKKLLQMGFSYQQVEKLIDYACYYELLDQGLGKLIWCTAKQQKISPLEAGERLCEGLYWYEWSITIADKKGIK
ncbi:MAG: D-ornithine 4,5-aminomutase subunit OraS [Bacillota bacterium]|nr:D-ornithine 4,5-aminomutase subunit OraS [Bacillota bacterium]